MLLIETNYPLWHYEQSVVTATHGDSMRCCTCTNPKSSIGATLAPMTSLPIQDGGPHDVRSKMAAPTTSNPRWRPPQREIQDGGPTKSDTRWWSLWRVRLHLGGWVNALDHERVASRPRARCRSSIYKGEGPLIYFWVVFYEVQNEIQSLMV